MGSGLPTNSLSRRHNSSSLILKTSSTSNLSGGTVAQGTLLARGDLSHERVLEAAFLLTDAQSAVRKHATSGATAVAALVVPDCDGGREEA